MTALKMEGHASRKGRRPRIGLRQSNASLSGRVVKAYSDALADCQADLERVTGELAAYL